MKFDSFLSDKLGDRLANIEKIFEVAAANSVLMCVKGVISMGVLSKMRELNRTRNAFSHSAAISEQQAQEYIAECSEDVLEVLSELKALKDFKVLRYLSQEGLKRVKCESFEGHAMTRTIKKTDLSEQQVKTSGHYLQKDQMLVLCPNYLLAPRPFIFFQQDGAGHTTKLCFLKKAKGTKPDRKLLFEVVGEAREIELDRLLFKPELDELRALLALSPD
jgi:hypothetical protein